MKNPKQLRSVAHARITQAIRAKIIKPAKAYKCVDCGVQAQAYDHRDYRKPFFVDPVCNKCNARRGQGYPPTNGDSYTINKKPRMLWGNKAYSWSIMAHHFIRSGEYWIAVCGFKQRDNEIVNANLYSKRHRCKKCCEGMSLRRARDMLSA